MSQLKGKVAIVTGASAGIGAATVKILIRAGLKVVGVARRKERIEALAKDVKGAEGKLYAFQADVSKEEEIIKAFEWVTENVGPVFVLVNNAGINAPTELIDGDAKKWKSILDVNVLGVTIASREAIKIMRANNIDGHIVNINSVAGHKIPNMPGINVYPASKYAVTALTETLRLELIRLGSKIRVTSLSPGVVSTEIFDGFNSTVEEIQKFFQIEKVLDGEDIGNAVLYVISTPPHVQVKELTIQPVGQKD